MVTRDEMLGLITIVDRHMVEDVAPAEVQNAWRILRGELRRVRRQSEQVMPAASTAAQHAALARDHAERALDALGMMTSKADPDSER